MAIIAARQRRIRRGGGLTPTSPAISGAVSQVRRTPAGRGRLTPYMPGSPSTVRKQPIAQPVGRPSPVVGAPVAASPSSPRIAPGSRPTPRIPQGLLPGLAPSPFEASRPAPGGLTGLNRFRGTAGPVGPEIFKLAQRRSTGVPGNTHYESKILNEKELK